MEKKRRVRLRGAAPLRVVRPLLKKRCKTIPLVLCKHTDKSQFISLFTHNVVEAFSSCVADLFPFDGLEEGDDGDGDIGVHKEGKHKQEAYFFACGGVDFLPFAYKGYESHNEHNAIGKENITYQAFNHGRGIAPTEYAEKY